MTNSSTAVTWVLESVRCDHGIHTNREGTSPESTLWGETTPEENEQGPLRCRTGHSGGLAGVMTKFPPGTSALGPSYWNIGY